MLYQPSTRETAPLWAVKPDDPNFPYYEEARKILADVNAFFAYGNRGWECKAAAGSNTYRIALMEGVPTCECAEYVESPMISPRPKGRHVRHCRHTLAYIGYREILAEQADWRRPAIPVNIRLWPIQGKVQPQNAFALFKFSEWLHKTLQGDTSWSSNTKEASTNPPPPAIQRPASAHAQIAPGWQPNSPNSGPATASSKAAAPSWPKKTPRNVNYWPDTRTNSKPPGPSCAQ